MLARAAAVDNFGAGRTLARMALAEGRSGEPDSEMTGLLRETVRLREEVAGLRRDVKLIMWEFSIGVAGTLTGLVIIAVLASD